AVHYWHKAGQRASERSAHVEAISHLTKGLALLQTLPETRERVQQEVNMQIALGASLIATKGQADPEVGQIYTRARQRRERVPGSVLNAWRLLTRFSPCCVVCGCIIKSVPNTRRRMHWLLSF